MHKRSGRDCFWHSNLNNQSRNIPVAYSTASQAMGAAARTPASLWAIQLLLCASLATITFSSSAFLDPEMLQYLDRLYQHAKQLGRPLVNGEMNLLPEKAPSGFANSIRCFSDISASSVSDNSRTLQFNLSSVDSADEITAIDLVLKQPLSSHTYKTNLHEMSGEGSEMDLKLLDSSGEYEGEWHTLSVQNVQDTVDKVSGVRNYQLLLSLSGGGEAEMSQVLHEVKPMLLIYTNDRRHTAEQAAATTPTSPTTRRAAPSIRITKGRRLNRRQRRQVVVEPEPTLAELGKLSCRRQTKTISFSKLGWPGSRYTVITPGLDVNFTFCHGLCNDPIHSQLGRMYNNHARLMSLTEPELAEARVTPCCVQDESTPIEVTYHSRITHVTIMTTIPHVNSCRCL